MHCPQQAPRVAPTEGNVFTCLTDGAFLFLWIDVGLKVLISISVLIMNNTKENGLRKIEKSAWQLAYTDEFKAFVHEHPSVIGDVITRLGKLTSSGSKEKQIIDEDGIKITVEKKRLKANIFSVELHGRKFFLKMGKYLEGGYDEIISAEEARQRIEEVGNSLPVGVEVINYQLGFTQGNLNFFVAPWQNIRELSEYQEEIAGSLENQENFDKTITILV